MTKKILKLQDQSKLTNESELMNLTCTFISVGFGQVQTAINNQAGSDHQRGPSLHPGDACVYSIRKKAAYISAEARKAERNKEKQKLQSLMCKNKPHQKKKTKKKTPTFSVGCLSDKLKDLLCCETYKY